MALRTLYPVRLMDGCSSGGFQIVLLEEKDTEQLWRALPEFLLQMERWRKEDFPTGSAAVEWFAAGAPDELAHSVRTGLHVRFRLPENVNAKQIDALCRREAEKAVGWLMARSVHCDLPQADEEGTACLYPSGEDAQLRFFTKERRLGRQEADAVCYFSPLCAMAPIRLREIAAALRESAGRGLSLHILPEMEGCEKQKAKAREALNRLPKQGPWAEEGSLRWGMALTVWGAGREDAGRLADQVTRILLSSGVFVTARSPRPDGFDRAAQMAHDPWALLDWYMSQIGVRLAAQAVSLSPREMDGVFQFAAESPAAAGDVSFPDAADERLDSRVREVGDERLNQLAEKLDQRLSTEQFLTVASEMMARLDALMGKENELDDRMGRLDALMGAQEAVYMKRLDALEASVKESVAQGTRLVLDQMRTSLEGVMEKLADLPGTRAGAEAAAESLAAALPPQVDIALTDEEKKALGIEREEDLTAQGMTDGEIRLLRIALTLARMGLKQTDENDQYMPFAAPLGCLYEMMVRNSFDRRITEAELESRRKEYEEKQAAAFRADRRMPPSSKEETELSFYDYISRQRVCEGYFKHVTVNGKKLLDPMEWNIWFSCFKFVRSVRNKVHPGCGTVGRNELETLYRLMLLPGAEHKWNALEYLLSHPVKGTKGGLDGSLLIRHYDERKNLSPRNTMRQYIAQYGAGRFRDSLIHFLLKFRNTAEWQND